MRKEKKILLILLAVSGGLGITNSLVDHFNDNEELLLALRLGGIVFFLGVYFWVRSIIKKQQKMIQESNGFIQSPFDPTVLKHFLLMFIVGWTVFVVADYFAVNPFDWLPIYILGITIFPFASGMIPLRIKDNKWRK
ncbi:MAG TPA: hypothetical protein VLD38_00200 [Nitrosopumilaceae archaeon]|nr:hypothetical protein [Nitrosopumilaceae archaeon]